MRRLIINRNRRGFGIDPNKLPLPQLPDPVVSEAAVSAIVETRRGKAEFQARYGKDWFREWVKATSCSVDHDLRLRAYNNAIYGTGAFGASGDPASVADDLAGYELRCRDLYGDRYDELRIHPDKDPRVVRLLLDDAVRTGRWKELPEALHAEYRRAGIETKDG